MCDGSVLGMLEREGRASAGRGASAGRANAGYSDWYVLLRSVSVGFWGDFSMLEVCVSVGVGVMGGGRGEEIGGASGGGGGRIGRDGRGDVDWGWEGDVNCDVDSVGVYRGDGGLV